MGGDQTPEEERKEILEMRQVTLNDLYKELPGSKEAIENSVGYAVFDNVGINLFAVSTGNGEGVAHDKKTGKDTFMKMFSAGVGIGLGIKDFRGIFVFTTQEAIDNFVNYNLSNGWYLTSTTVMTADWEKPSDQQWTIPLGGGIGKLARFGKQPVDFKLQGFGNVEKPDGGPEWSLQFAVKFLFPK